MALMVVDLPGMNGIEATKAIVTERPSTEVVVMSAISDPDAMLVAAIGAGAVGFLSKTEAASKILGAVRAGSNENTNGLLGPYFPKSTDLTIHTPADLLAVAAELNARPRRTLNGDTPAERLNRLLPTAA